MNIDTQPTDPDDRSRNTSGPEPTALPRELTPTDSHGQAQPGQDPHALPQPGQWQPGPEASGGSWFQEPQVRTGQPPPGVWAPPPEGYPPGPGAVPPASGPPFHSAIPTPHSAFSTRPALAPLGRPAPSLRPPKAREFLALLAAVVVADVTLYLGGGFAGFGVLFLAIPLLLLFGARRRRFSAHVWVALGLLVAVGFRLIWLGNEWTVFVGVLLTLGFSMALTGLPPFLLEGILFSVPTVATGIARLAFFMNHMGRHNPKVRSSWLAWIVPIVALVVFGGIFVLANPDLRDTVSRLLSRFFTDLSNFIPYPGRVVFWFFALWVMAGLLRPYVDHTQALLFLRKRESVPVSSLSAPPDWSFPMARNTLFALIALFAVYLLFEIKSMWGREFPKGFYYSGYAHQGAAWLTVALALATAVMGIVFQGGILAHPRLAGLKRLAWFWSAENLVLAVCVFHRTQIYVNYNGMSRMRVVALFGIAVVVAGFALVVIKVIRGKNFLWLVRRQLWALALTLILLTLAPVDWFVTKYNVSRVLGGNPAPLVQIATHSIDASGVPQLLPLLKSSDPVVRDGIAALVGRRWQELSREPKDPAETKNWTHVQLARVHALKALNSRYDSWSAICPSSQWDQATLRFQEYARQWYD